MSGGGVWDENDGMYLPGRQHGKGPLTAFARRQGGLGVQGKAQEAP